MRSCFHGFSHQGAPFEGSAAWRFSAFLLSLFLQVLADQLQILRGLRCFSMSLSGNFNQSLLMENLPEGLEPISHKTSGTFEAFARWRCLKCALSVTVFLGGLVAAPRSFFPH